MSVRHALPGEVLLATGNCGKAAELQQMLMPLNIHVRLQSELNIEPVEETGLTFVENALLKARHTCRTSGLPTIADDSGLEVDALGGAPGIYSARYAGRQGDDTANNRLLLERLRGLPDEQRTARFQCLLVYLRHAEDPTPLICQGTWDGRILDAPRGDNGFGYDPLFLVPDRGQTSAELSPEVKNRISHRGQALQQLLTHLRKSATT